MAIESFSSASSPSSRKRSLNPWIRVVFPVVAILIALFMFLWFIRPEELTQIDLDSFVNSLPLTGRQAANRMFATISVYGLVLLIGALITVKRRSATSRRQLFGYLSIFTIGALLIFVAFGASRWIHEPGEIHGFWSGALVTGIAAAIATLAAATTAIYAVLLSAEEERRREFSAKQAPLSLQIKNLLDEIDIEFDFLKKTGFGFAPDSAITVLIEFSRAKKLPNSKYGNISVLEISTLIARTQNRFEPIHTALTEVVDRLVKLRGINDFSDPRLALTPKQVVEELEVLLTTSGFLNDSSISQLKYDDPDQIVVDALKRFALQFDSETISNCLGRIELLYMELVENFKKLGIPPRTLLADIDFALEVFDQDFLNCVRDQTLVSAENDLLLASSHVVYALWFVLFDRIADISDVALEELICNLHHELKSVHLLETNSYLNSEQVQLLQELLIRTKNSKELRSKLKNDLVNIFDDQGNQRHEFGTDISSIFEIWLNLAGQSPTGYSPIKIIMPTNASTLVRSLR